MSRVVLLTFLVGVTACSGKTSDKGTADRTPSGVKAIPECVEYQSALERCFHRETGFATQPSMLPKNDEDRKRLQQMCSENLARLTTACR